MRLTPEVALRYLRQGRPLYYSAWRLSDPYEKRSWLLGTTEESTGQLRLVNPATLALPPGMAGYTLDDDFTQRILTEAIGQRRAELERERQYGGYYRRRSLSRLPWRKKPEDEPLTATERAALDQAARPVALGTSYDVVATLARRGWPSSLAGVVLGLLDRRLLRVLLTTDGRGHPALWLVRFVPEVVTPQATERREAEAERRFMEGQMGLFGNPGLTPEERAKLENLWSARPTGYNVRRTDEPWASFLARGLVVWEDHPNPWGDGYVQPTAATIAALDEDFEARLAAAALSPAQATVRRAQRRLRLAEAVLRNDELAGRRRSPDQRAELDGLRGDVTEAEAAAGMRPTTGAGILSALGSPPGWLAPDPPAGKPARELVADGGDYRLVVRWAGGRWLGRLYWKDYGGGGIVWPQVGRERPAEDWLAHVARRRQPEGNPGAPAVETLLRTYAAEDLVAAAAHLRLESAPLPNRGEQLTLLDRHQDAVAELLARYKPEDIVAAARRVGRPPLLGESLTSGYDLYRFALTTWPELMLHGHELAYVIGTDSDLRPLKTWLVSEGGIDEVSVDVRRVLAPALDSTLPITGLFFLHGHPTGLSTPSGADTRLTARLRMSAQLVGLTLHDHVIVGDAGYYSFNEAGTLGAT